MINPATSTNKKLKKEEIILKTFIMVLDNLVMYL